MAVDDLKEEAWRMVDELYLENQMTPPDRSMVNTEKPETRCGSCGGKCRVGYDPIYKRGARVIHCNSGFPKMGPCAWTSMSPARVDPAWYWKLKVRLGWGKSKVSSRR